MYTKENKSKEKKNLDNSSHRANESRQMRKNKAVETRKKQPMIWEENLARIEI